MNPASTSACPISLMPILEESGRSLAHCRQCAGQAARLDFFVTLGETLFSVLMGLMTGSAGLRAMALLTTGDVLSKGINWMAVRFSQRQPTARFPYGYGRIQFLSALFIGVFLAGGAVLFLLHDLRHLQGGPIEQPGGLAALSALLLAASSGLMYRIMACAAAQNIDPGIHAAALDNRVDFWSSVAVLVGALLTHFGFLMADRLMALVIAALVIKLGIGLVVDAVQGLLDIGLPVEIQRQVAQLVKSAPGVAGVKHLRGRRMGGSYEIDLEVRLPGECSVREAHAIRTELSRTIRMKVRYVDAIQISFCPG
ncbi:MAG: cation transporter [Magnetococcales bacterium]|nr:cation transporter [Magnetococcales bacterium]